MIDLDKSLTLGDLLEGLEIDADFSGWCYGGAENDLTITLKFGDHIISKTNVRIEPVGFEREKDQW